VLFGAVVVCAAAGVTGVARARPRVAPSVNIGPAFGRFYPNPTGGGAFSVKPSQTPAWVQTFPVIDFNPPTGSVKCRNKLAVEVNTRPFTDVIPQPNGTCTTLVAQGNGQQAGALNTPFLNFFTAFTTTFTVSAAGDVPFEFFSDDGWILGIGAGPGGARATYLSGSRFKAPARSALLGYAVVGALNTITAPTGSDLVVHFPVAGTYPVELDYTEGAGGQLSLTLTANGKSIAPGKPSPPEVARTVNAAAVSGKVEARVPGTTQFVPVGTLTQLPVGTEFDTTKGRIKLTSAAGGGKMQTAEFYGGRFIVSQKKAKSPITNLTLSGPLVPCASCRIPSAVGAQPLKERHLWGTGKGHFRTRGRYASATVRGTYWEVEDFAKATVVRVRTGTVEVADNVKHRTVMVGAHHVYVAKPGGK
jgi:hypothetical protein